MVIPFEVAMKSRLVVIPDVHRDLPKAKAILRHCNVTDTDNRWMCYDTVVVQMGDQVDGGDRRGLARGAHEHGRATAEDVETLRFFDGLAAQAPERNSLCVSLIGNHEVMNVAGLFQYAGLDGCVVCARAREAVFRQGSQLAAGLADSRACVLKVGAFLFSHAGVTRDHLARVNGDLGMYNRYAQAVLRGEGRKFHLLDALIGAEGLLSHREYQPTNVTDATVAGAAEVLAATGASHMVTAHNTTPGRVMVFGDKAQLIVFDPGMSHAVADQNPAALDIRDGKIDMVRMK